jgi:membrane glycosyltransferase
LRDAINAFFPHTVAAFILGATAWYLMPAAAWWYLPLLTGLFFAIPVAWLTSLPSLGTLAQRFGLFLIPSETTGLSIAARVDNLVDSAADSTPIITEVGRRAA